MYKSKLKIFFIIILSITIFIHFTLIAIAENDCEDTSQPIPNLPGDSDYSKMNCNCANPPEGTFTFDDDNTPDTIVKDSSIEVYIIGGCPPFTFSTSSTGYDFEGESNYETGKKHATLFCVNGACGVDFDVTASIKVTDGCETEVEAVIRNTAGNWGPEVGITDCPCAGVYDEYEYIGTMHHSYKYIGNKRYHQYTARKASHTCCGGTNPCSTTWCVWTPDNFARNPCILAKYYEYQIPCFEVISCDSPCDGPWGLVYCMEKTLRVSEWTCP